MFYLCKKVLKMIKIFRSLRKFCPLGNIFKKGKSLGKTGKKRKREKRLGN